MNISNQKKINIKSSKLMNSLFIWNFKAAFSWKGIEFQDFREYSYGDDAKYIDWSVSSREQSTIIRRYREEKQWNILCVVDMWDSLSYSAWVKQWIYREVLALLYHGSKLSWESFGWYVLDNLWSSFIPASKTPIWYHKLDKLSKSYRDSRNALRLSFMMKNPMKRSVVFVVSDSLNIDEKSFKLAALKHDVVYVHVSSNFENTLDGKWISRLRWFTRWFSIDLDDEKKRLEYALKRKEKLDNFSKKLKKYWVDSIFLDEDTSIFAEFLKLMKRRERT